jgi:hypothetical protein
MEQVIQFLSGTKWEGTMSIRSLVSHQEVVMEGKYELEITEGTSLPLKGNDTFQDEPHDVVLQVSDEEGYLSVEFTSGTNVKMNGIVNLKGHSISGVTVGLDGSSGTFTIQKK